MPWYDDDNFFGSVAHAAGVAAERASQVVPDVFGAAGDLATDVVQGVKNIAHGALSPNADSKDLFKGMSVPGSGKLGTKAKQNYRKAEEKVLGVDNIPEARNTSERYLGSAAEMATNFMTGGGEAALAAKLGAAAGGLSEGAHDLFPNSQVAPIIATLLPLIGHAGVGAVRSVQGARMAAEGAAHPAFPTLVKAVTELEGGGTLDAPKTNTSSGAMGPMQVMPDTARKPGYGIKPWDGKSQEDLARVGVQKLAVLNKMFDGDTEKALAAYNWGEGNVKSAIRRFGDNWIAHAPEETKNYVDNGLKKLGPQDPRAPDGLPGNGSVPPVDPEALKQIMGETEAKQNMLDDVNNQANDNVPLENNVVDKTDVFGQKQLETLHNKIYDLHNDIVENGKVVDPEALKGIRSELDDQIANHEPGTPEHNILLNTADLVDSSIAHSGGSPDLPLSEGADPYLGQEPVDTAPANDNAQYHKVEDASAPKPDVASSVEPQTADPKVADNSNDFSTDPSVGIGAGYGGDGSLPPEGPPPPPETMSVFERLKTALDESKPGLAIEEEARKTERSKRLAAVGRARATMTGEARRNAMRSALQGDLPNVDFPEIRSLFTPEDVAALHDHINNSPVLHGYDPVNASQGLDRLLDGKLPQDHQLKLLYKVLPPDLMESIMKKRAKNWKEWTVDLANVPRSLMSSVDVSAPGRQGIVLIGSKAYWTSMDDMFKAFSPTKAKAINQSIISDPRFAEAQEAGLYHAEMTDFLQSREEAFKSPLAEKIPVIGHLVKGSERAYVTYLNKLRFDHFKNVLGRMEANGREITPQFKETLADFINTATGRGDLGKLEKAGDILGAAFFSPRLVKSRFDLANPLWYYKLYRQDPMAAKEAVKSVTVFAGIMGSLLTAAAKSGVATVETDLRSPDAYKLKIGNTRIDVSGGILPILRLYAEIASQSKMTGKGKIVKFTPDNPYANNGEIALHFARSKLSPAGSFGIDWYLGQDFNGKDTTLFRSVSSRLAPMITGDLTDAISDQGVKGLWVGLPSAAGLGVSTYDTSKPINRHAPDPLQKLFHYGNGAKKAKPSVNDDWYSDENFLNSSTAQ